MCHRRLLAATDDVPAADGAAAAAAAAVDGMPAADCKKYKCIHQLFDGNLITRNEVEGMCVSIEDKDTESLATPPIFCMLV